MKNSINLWISDTPQMDAMNGAQLAAHTKRLIHDDGGIRDSILAGKTSGIVGYVDDTGFAHRHEWRIMSDEELAASGGFSPPRA